MMTARRPHAAAGERRVEHVGQRARDEPQQARVVEDRHRELAPHRQEAHRLGDALRAPSCRRRPPSPRRAPRRPARSAAGTRSPGRGRGRRRPGRRRPSSARPAGSPPSWWSSWPARPTRCTGRGWRARARGGHGRGPSAGTSAALMTFARSRNGMSASRTSISRIQFVPRRMRAWNGRDASTSPATGDLEVRSSPLRHRASDVPTRRCGGRGRCC